MASFEHLPGNVDADCCNYFRWRASPFGLKPPSELPGAQSRPAGKVGDTVTGSRVCPDSVTDLPEAIVTCPLRFARAGEL